MGSFWPSMSHTPFVRAWDRTLLGCISSHTLSYRVTTWSHTPTSRHILSVLKSKFVLLRSGVVLLIFLVLSASSVLV